MTTLNNGRRSCIVPVPRLLIIWYGPNGKHVSERDATVVPATPLPASKSVLALDDGVAGKGGAGCPLKISSTLWTMSDAGFDRLLRTSLPPRPTERKKSCLCARLRRHFLPAHRAQSRPELAYPPEVFDYETQRLTAVLSGLSRYASWLGELRYLRPADRQPARLQARQRSRCLI